VHQAYGATPPGSLRGRADETLDEDTIPRARAQRRHAARPRGGGGGVRPLATRLAGATDSRMDQQANGDRGRSLISTARCLTGFDRLPMPRGLRFAHLRFTAHDAFRVSPVRLIPRQKSLLLATESLLKLRGLEGRPSEVRSAK